MTQTPVISIVIPIYNEQAILQAAVLELREKLLDFPEPYEILLAENGSSDRTLDIAAELGRKIPQVRFIALGEPNYGKALRAGILSALGEIVICDEIDLCDSDFHRRAIDLLRTDAFDMVIGSKLLAGARDERPFVRHAASLVYNGLLRAAVGFEGTDTHGLKAFRRDALLPVVRACLVDRDVFASELVVRAYRAGLRVREIPVRVLEKRTPSINLTRRVPNVIKNVARLTWAVRVRG
jgi:glycosyltransferase involved in cell wall biosynthesis